MYSSVGIVSDISAIALISIISSNFPFLFKIATGFLATLGIWVSDGRTSLAVISLVIISIIISKNKSRLIRLLVVISLIIVLAFVGDYAINDHISTCDIATYNEFSTLDGRLPLWSYVVSLIWDNLHTGVGFYASRYFLSRQFEWAGQTHNSFLEIGLGTGIIGLIICALFILSLMWAIWRTNDTLLLGIAIYCIGVGIVGPVIFYPCFPMFTLIVALVKASSYKLKEGVPLSCESLASRGLEVL